MILTRYEQMIARRYLLPGKGEGFIFLVAAISLVAVMLGVAALITVMSIMNGFRAELFDKIVGLNGHAVIQGYDGRLSNWEEIAALARKTPGVVSVTPLIEQPLLATYNGRVEAAIVRGMTDADIRSNPSLSSKIVSGSLADVRTGRRGRWRSARASPRIWASRSARRSASSIRPAAPRRSAPLPRQVAYDVGAIFEIGIYDFDDKFIIMPMQDAQTLLLLGDQVQMVEVKTDNPENVAEILKPLAPKVKKWAAIVDWRQMNASLFEALQVDRVVSFVILSLLILIAVFNILSSLIMLVWAKKRDIAILRTMGASRGSLLRIFVTVGLTIGTMGTMAGAALGFILLYFRQGILDGVQTLTGQQIWIPRSDS